MRVDGKVQKTLAMDNMHNRPLKIEITAMYRWS